MNNPRIKMEINENRIFDVKSTSEIYKSESSGRKPNTSRFTDDWDEAKWIKYHSATHIRVNHTGIPISFIRAIVNKCEYKNLAIISWKHPIE